MSTKKYFNHMAINIDKTLKGLNQRILIAENNIEGMKQDISFLEDISTEIKNGTSVMKEEESKGGKTNE